MVTATRFLERDQELDTLERLLADLDSSGGKVVLIRGEAGIGKSALVRQFLTDHANEAHVLIGWCDDLLTPQPLGPFWDIARKEPELLEPLANGNRAGLLAATLDLLERGLRPTILVIEDTQWAGEATLDAVKYLGRRIEHTNSLLILTYRDTEVDYDHPLRTVIGHLPPDRVVRIRLAGLSLDAVSFLITGSDLDAEAVFSTTDGNPFLAGEMAAGGGDAVPASVSDSVMARVAKLSPDAQRVLRILSVIPERISRDEVSGFIGEAGNALEQCIQSGLLDAGRKAIVFHHELTRQAVEASLTPQERVTSNRLVLANLSPDIDPARLVHHAREAGDIDRLIELAPRAARSARAVRSHREALEQFRLLSPYVDRLEADSMGVILEEWAYEESEAFNRHEAIRLIELGLAHARERGDTITESRMLAASSEFHELTGQRAKAEELAEQAMEVLGPEPRGLSKARALEVKAYLAMMAYNGVSAIELADKAIEAAGPDADERFLVRCLVHKGTAANLIHYPDGKEILAEARRRAEAIGAWREILRTFVNHADPAFDNRDLPTAWEHASKALEVGAAHGQNARIATGTQAKTLELRGEWRQAEDIAGDVLDSLETAAVMAYPVVGVIEARQGRRAARKTLDHAWELAVRAEDLWLTAPTAAAMLEYAWISGDINVSLGETLKVMEQALVLRLSWLAGLIAFWLWKLGRLEEIPARIAEPYRLVMRGESREAAELLRSLGLRYEQAIALSHGDAADRLEALEILDELGATAVADKLRQELREHGVKVPRRRARKSGDGAGLTARQTEVLALLAENLANVDIADRLFLSPRTVEHHVAAVMSKLDASTRSEAVEKAADQGLIGV